MERMILILLMGVILVSGCIQQEVIENPKIGDIISNPSEYGGKAVMIEGEYGGKGENTSLTCDYENMGRIMKKDTIIYDETGCLYMTSGVEFLYKEKELYLVDPMNIDVNIKIKAVVNLIDGKPILGGKISINLP